MASTISANVDNGTAVNLRVVASLENRSVSPPSLFRAPNPTDSHRTSLASLISRRP